MFYQVNDLTKGNILRNLIFLSLPIMLSNFMQTLYNLIDTFWLGRLTDHAKEAVSSVGIVFPLVFFISSFGIGFMIAGTTIIAQLKGSGRSHKIKFFVGQFVFILFTFSAFLLIIAFFFIDDILIFLNTPPEIFTTTAEYFKLIVIGLVFMMVFLAYQSIAHGLGDTVTPMLIQVISLSINLIIDPLLIFGWFFFPELGVLGAGYATLFSRIIASVLAIFYLLRRNKDFLPSINQLKPNLNLLKQIVKIGVPASFSQSITSLGFLILQGFVNSYGIVVISVYTIGNRLIGFFLMPAIGVSNALTAIIGQNLGAGNIKRAEKSVFLTFVLTMSIMTLGSAILYFQGHNLIKFFVNEPEVIIAGARMFRITSLSANFFGFVFVFTGVFNGAGQTMITLFFSIARLWLFRIPLVYILSGRLIEIYSFNSEIVKKILILLSEPLSKFPYDSLWWSMLISNVFAASIAFIFFIKGNWKRKKVV